LCSSNLLSGGAGDDNYLIDNTSDAVLENANEGIDIVHATDHFRLSANVETLVLLPGSGNLAGIGNALANAIHGNSGDNSLDGGANADVLTGSLGNDTFMSTSGKPTATPLLTSPATSQRREIRLGSSATTRRSVLPGLKWAHCTLRTAHER
jgi:Ca2+-binding RTX toxin-like protein